MTTPGINYPVLDYIASITNAQTAVVTFEEAHDFTNGEIISFRVSQPYGMVEMNNRQGRVLARDTLTVTVDIDTTGFNAFTIPGDETTISNPAIAVPSASGIVPGFYTPFINLEDAFDNRPPN